MFGAFLNGLRFLCIRTAIFMIVSVLVFSDFDELLKNPFAPEFKTAEAATGDIAIFRETTGTETVPGVGTPFDVTWDTSVATSSNITLQGDSSSIDLADGGKYLVMYSAWAEQGTSTAGTNRRAIESYMTLNGTESPYGRANGFIRDAEGDLSAYAAGGSIINATAGDDLQLHIRRSDTNSTAGTNVPPNTNGISVIKLKDGWDYLRVQSTATSADISGNTSFTDVQWNTADEVDTGSFGFTATSGNITLKGAAGSHFLVTTNVRLNYTAVSNTRQNYEMQLTLNGTEIPGTRTTTYPRGNQNGNGIFYGTLVYTGIITKTSASDQTLNVEVRRESSGSGTTVIMANKTALAITKLPDTAEYIMLTDQSGTQALTSSRVAMNWNTENEIDTTAFSHSIGTNPSRINIDKNGNYLFFSTVYSTTTTSGNNRQPHRIDWRKNGSTLFQYGGHGGYNRANTTFSAGSSGGLVLNALTDTDYLEITHIDETTTAPTDATFSSGRVSVQGVVLNENFFGTDVLVSATGSQNANVRIPTTDAELGGGFVITELTSSRNVTNVTLTESGTVDAQNDINNIEIWYDLDTSSPYDCASESYADGATQFGSTDTNGFSGANGVSSFSGSVAISTTQTMCAYVVYDVINTANDTDTVIISINNPSTDVTVSGGGSISPLTPISPTDSTTLQSAELTQIHYHWRNDDGTDETDATSATGGSEDTVLGALQIGTPKRLRLEVSNEGSVDSSPSVSVLDDFSTGTTKTISNGTNRLLVVGIHSEDSGTNVDINTVSYGGQTLTEVRDEQIGGGAANGMWVGYLTESQIALASGNTISPTWNGGTPDTSVLYSSVVLENVYQASPITGFSGGGATSASTVQPTTTVPVSAGDRALYFTVTGATAQTHSPPTDYSEGTEQDNGLTVSSNAHKLITLDGTEQPTATWTGTNNRLLIVALGVQYATTTSGTNIAGYRLEYATRSTVCSEATGWIDVGAFQGDWDMFDSSKLTDGEDTTNIAVGLGGVSNEATTFFSPNGSVRDTSSETGPMFLPYDHYAELEYSIVPTASSTEGSTYCFRLTHEGAEVRNYSVYPEATINADVVVSATGTQVATVNEPSTNNYIGGGFVIRANTGTPNVNDITITETGTIDGSGSIDNVRLYYELDTSTPYDCGSESYAGDELQFGATSTAGFSAPNGSSTFSGSVGISTTQSMCVYVVLDVNATSTDGETIDIEISSPNTQVVVSSGSVAPGSIVGITGSTTISGPILTQTRYHWRNDDGSELGASSATGGIEDTVLLDVPKGSTRRVRMQVSNEGSVSSLAAQYRLEYGTKISTCGAIGPTSWQDVDVGNAFVMASTSQLIEGNNTTDIGTTTGGTTNPGGKTFLSSNGGQREITSQTGSLTLTSTEFVELEFAIEATVDSGYATTYCFRLTDAGSELETYTSYAELTTRQKQDFFVQRGVATVSGTSTTLVAGIDYTAPVASTSAFIRITNTQMTGAGNDTGGGNTNADDATAYIENPENITSNIVIARPSTALSNTRVAWEIVEFVGTPGTDNEMIVRDQGTVAFVSSEVVATGTSVSTVANDSKVVVFITGQVNPDTLTASYNTGIATALWHATNSVPVFTRGEANGIVAEISYAIVEFTGQNWLTQRIEHTYALAGTTETESITAVGSLNRSFVHVQKRVGVGLNGLDEFGHEVWLSSVGALSFKLYTGADTPSDHHSVAWVIENTQTTSGFMNVYRSNGTIAAGGASEPLSTIVPIGGTLNNLSNSSIWVNNSGAGTGTAFPRTIFGVILTSTTEYELWRSDTGQPEDYRTEVIEWPVADTTLRQNYYRFYVDNDALDPTDPWPAGAANLGENTSITAVDDPIAEGEVVRIRATVVVSNATLPELSKSLKLQYGKRDTTCSAISVWTDVGAIGSGAIWRGYNGSPADGATLGTTTISIADVLGTYEEQNNSAVNPFAVSATQDVEYDWLVQHNGAQQKTNYCFRMVESDDTVFASYFNYPTLRTTGYTPVSATWRWYDDATSTTPVNPLAVENVAPADVENQNEIKLRVGVHEIESASGSNVRFTLQYSEYSDFSDGGNWVTASSTCTANSLWCYVDGAGNDASLIDSKVLSDSDACTGGSGNGCGHHNEGTTTPSTLTQPANSKMEFEFTLKNAGARVNRVYYFRLYDQANDDFVFASSTYPSLVTEGAKLSFTMNGIASSTVIEGITTDIDTTATQIYYGSLPLDTDVEAAQRLSVDANGTEGYKIVMYSTSDFVSSSGDTIAPITGSNTSPSSWLVGCTGSALGCFGYHTGDDFLEGDSTRFFAPDTYARFSSTTAEEIAFTSNPVVNETVDIVFKLKVRDLQEAGLYETNIVYIAIPMF